MSNRWPAHSQGSLVISTSPGTSVSGGNFASSAFTARGRVRLNTGMARGECARSRRRGSSRSQAKSCASETISEKAVRQTVCHISSTTVTRRLHMISSETGSASISARGLSERRVRGDARGRRGGDGDAIAQSAGGVDA